VKTIQDKQQIARHSFTFSGNMNLIRNPFLLITFVPNLWMEN